MLPGRQTVAASLNNRDLARILEWCNHWCIILNPNKTKVFVVSRSKTLILPYGDLVLSGVSICANPNLDILGVKFDSMLTFEKTMSVALFPVLSENWHFEVDDTFVLFCCYYVFVVFVLPILEHYSPAWGQLLDGTFSYSSARCFQWPGFALIRVSCCVIDVMLLDGVCCTRLIRTLITVC